MIKSIITLILFAFSFTLCYAQSGEKDAFVEFEINGKKYDSLYMYAYFEIGAPFKSDGTTTNGVNWRFIIPDSIYEKSRAFDLHHPTGCDTILNMIFLTGNGNRYYVPKNSVLRLDFIKSKTISNNSFFRFKDAVIDTYERIVDCQEVELVHKVMANKYFSSKQIDTLKSYIVQFPDSHGLIATIGTNVSEFESREDLVSVYELFSDSNKQSYFGKRIHTFLYGGECFTDTELLNPITGNKEFIVSDKSKPTLVIFSASWCAPCHKAIPIYKQAYSDLKDIMNFVYITIDEPKFIEAWNKIVKQEEIPWRSLAALNDSDKIRKLYYVDGVPYSFLIMPDNSITRLELREESDMKKLYEKVKR